MLQFLASSIAVNIMLCYDINADRKTLYQDFEELRQFGFDLISEQIGHNTYYFLGGRTFELPELKLLVDSVQSAKFITDKKSHELSSIIKSGILRTITQVRKLTKYRSCITTSTPYRYA